MNQATPLFVRNGHCVSCGRAAERGSLDCPYCGEQVWHPRIWYALRRCILPATALLVLSAGALLTAAPGWHALHRSVCSAPLTAAWLAACALGWLALPADTDGSATGAKDALRRQQREAMFGGAAQALSAVTGTVLLAAVPHLPLPSLPVSLALFTCSALLPLFFRIPWSRLAAAAALAMTAAASIL
ncbi:MAG: hypothetical protein GX565_15375 [Lentisphaerae bacterium]|nr:hypothetical protein [Lentisphaerota bacterium]